MQKILTLLIALVICFQTLNAQVEKYHRLKINTPEATDINKLASLGISLENLESKPNVFIIGEFSETEIELIDASGLRYEVVIDDVSSYYQQRNAKYNIEELNNEMKAKRRNYFGYVTPANFSLGSMGGYHTYQELLNELDEMKSLYPNLISTKAAIGLTNTIENRPVYWVRISNDPQANQDKPKVLYTALTHAREPASMQQMLYQMWYILENYETNPEIQYLVDNLELFFIPCVNPDGYIYNQTTNPNGGGMWRKNRRNNGGSMGVDLNRNFGYQWGYDNSGSSPNGSSDTYRGTAPFSEPETQLVKQFVETREFTLALNNHTYSDILIYPWGYSNFLTPDANIFIEYAKLLTSENGYVYGTCYETLNYTANGVSDDWFYGEQTTKNKVFAFTPEAGSPSDGFWPAVNRIEEICAGHTGMNLYLARFALPYASITDKSSRIFNTLTTPVPFDLRSLGQVENPTYTVSIVPITSNIQTVSNPVTYSNMDVLEVVTDTIFITFKPNISNGEIVKFLFSLDNGTFTYTDTITKVYGASEIIIDDPCSNMNNWISSSWNTTTQHYYSSPTSINDSPGANYPNNSNTHITLAFDVDLTDAVMAWVEFMARWNIEANWDYAQFMVSTNNGTTWIPLQGKHTVMGGSNQDTNKPLYHGNQNQWVKEEVSLDNYLGSTIKLRFRLVSDVTINGLGFFFDDFKLEKMVASTNPIISLPEEIVFNQGEVVSIDARDYISNFNTSLTLSWSGNQNISIVNNDWILSITNSSPSWSGEEVVTFTVNGDSGESSCDVSITCVFTNTVPVIVGQSFVYTLMDTPIDLSLDFLMVEDNDNNFPDDFTLLAYPGENFTLENLTVSPIEGYTGLIYVPVAVYDGISTSETFNLEILVIDPASIPVIVGQNYVFTLMDTPIELSFEYLKVVDENNTYPDGFTLSAFEGDNYTLDDLTVIPSEGFIGNIFVPVTVSDGLNTSNVFNLVIEVINPANIPSIVGQNYVYTLMGSPILLSIEFLLIEDEDSVFPNDFSLTAYPGENYSLSQLTITPSEGFIGFISVPVVVFDGTFTSEIFNLEIEVINPANVPTITGQNYVSTSINTPLLLSLDFLIVEDEDSLFPDEFILNVFAGSNYTISNQTITPTSNFIGFLSVPVSVSDGTFTSEIFNLEVEVINTTITPVITGQQQVSTNKGITLSLSLDHLIVEDEDSVYPDDFTLFAFEGDNYYLENLQITPHQEFVGSIFVPVAVSDGINTSEIFNLEVVVIDPSNDVISQTGDVSIRYVAKDRLLYIEFNPSAGYKRADIINILGSTVDSKPIETNQKFIVFNVNRLSSGVFVIRLLGKGESFIARKIVL